MISILGILLEEYDADDRPPAPEYAFPGEYTDMEIQRVSVFSSVRHDFSFSSVSSLILCSFPLRAFQVMELTSMRLLHRTTPTERLDGPPMFKCAVPYEAVLRVARNLRIPLNDLMWEPA
jgi:origin recognition complex subunit 5